MLISKAKPDRHAAHASWSFLGAHGGAGTSTLVRYSRQHGHTYATEHDPGQGTVVLVCRDHLAGLTAAQTLAAGPELAGRLAGIVVIGDAPGPMPRPISGSVRLLSGAAPQLWSVPYIPLLRLVPPAADLDAPWPAIHPDLAQVLHEIRSATAAGDTPRNTGRR